MFIPLLLNNKNTENSLSGVEWLLPIIFGALGLTSLIFIVKYSKRLIITDNYMQIDRIFLSRTFHYNFQDILGYDVHMNFSRYRDYESFHIKTNDNRLYMILDYEFQNYKQIKNLIQTKSNQISINKYHELRTILLILISSVIISGLVVSITLALM